MRWVAGKNARSVLSWLESSVGKAADAAEEHESVRAEVRNLKSSLETNFSLGSVKVTLLPFLAIMHINGPPYLATTYYTQFIVHWLLTAVKQLLQIPASTEALCRKLVQSTAGAISIMKASCNSAAEQGVLHKCDRAKAPC